jgi:hypothetical protein
VNLDITGEVLDIEGNFVHIQMGSGCQVPYRLRHLQSRTDQFRFGTMTTCTRKSTSPSIPIGLARPFLHPHWIPDPAPIPLSLDSSHLHYSFVPFRFTVAYADPRVWMCSTATCPLRPLRPWKFSPTPTRLLCDSPHPFSQYFPMRPSYQSCAYPHYSMYLTHALMYLPTPLL